MKKKILLVSILAVISLISISFASAMTIQVENKPNNYTVRTGNSPLFSIRTSRALNMPLDELRVNIKTRFLGDRLFFLPFQWLINKYDDYLNDEKEFPRTLCKIITCEDARQYPAIKTAITEFTCVWTVCKGLICTK